MHRTIGIADEDIISTVAVDIDKEWGAVAPRVDARQRIHSLETRASGAAEVGDDLYRTRRGAHQCIKVAVPVDVGEGRCAIAAGAKAVEWIGGARAIREHRTAATAGILIVSDTAGLIADEDIEVAIGIDVHHGRCR